MPTLRPEIYRPLNPAAVQGMTGRATVSILQARERCQVSRRTIYNWMATGKVQYVRNAGGAVRIFADTLFREGRPPA
jgi:hypothetical protein